LGIGFPFCKYVISPFFGFLLAYFVLMSNFERQQAYGRIYILHGLFTGKYKATIWHGAGVAITDPESGIEVFHIYNKDRYFRGGY